MDNATGERSGKRKSGDAVAIRVLLPFRPWHALGSVGIPILEISTPCLVLCPEGEDFRGLGVEAVL